MTLPRSFTLIGDRVDEVECFIPMTPRDHEVMRKFQEGPTEEERMATRLAEEQREAKRKQDMYVLESRHGVLRAIYSDGLVADLLHLHRPQATLFAGKSYLDCHGCPAYDDTGVQVHHEWPCPTWQTISDATP